MCSKMCSFWDPIDAPAPYFSQIRVCGTGRTRWDRKFKREMRAQPVIDTTACLYVSFLGLLLTGKDPGLFRLGVHLDAVFDLFPVQVDL
jgi:hypothetical protein